MAAIKSGVSKDALTIDTTSKAARLTLYGSTGLEQSYEQKATFGLTFSMGAGGTIGLGGIPKDLLTITGSKTKTIKLVSFAVATTNTTAMSLEYYLIKRRTLDVPANGATLVGYLPGIPFDSKKQPTATVFVPLSGVSLNLVGTFVGNINIKRVAVPVTIPTSWAGITRDNMIEMLPAIGPSILDSTITLRGFGECVVLNLNGISFADFGAGEKITVSIIWTEE